MEFSGRLASVPLSDLLQWASNDRRNGCLVVRTTHRQKNIFFRQGEVVGCYSDDPAEYFGQFLLLEGYMDADGVMSALTYCREHRKRLGEALVELRMMTAETVQTALRRQIEDLICELFLWNHGVFFFEYSIPDKEELLPEPVSTMGLVMEGTRWTDEHDRMRRVFIHDNIVFRRGSQWPGQDFSVRQERILELFVEGITLADSFALVKGSKFRFLEALFDLTVREILDIDSIGDEIAGRTSTEIRILDLLMEQAAEEEVLFSGRHLSLPLQTFDRFYPVWLEVDGEVAGLEPEALSFCRRMDGSNSIHSLVISSGGDRAARMEAILVELRKGNLVLLPRPLAEMTSMQDTTRGGWLRRLFQAG
ncbi:MAG: DUF4388 domain-containing protein [Thermoanaerobaculia bacterium]|nr:DUF4388 domain-containing protein [Thermoanaerobaculia bacterium]